MPLDPSGGSNITPPSFFKAMALSQAAINRTVESLGVPFSDPFNEEAVIADVNDPLNMGRVKVITSDDITSDWIPVTGSIKGRLSAKFIGAKVLVTKKDGRSEDMYVISVLSSGPELGVVGNPVQIPIIDEGIGVWSGSNDAGMRCNESNEGRLYVLSNEMNQDLVVCLRRSSPQTGSGDRWAWKSLTSGLWVEKGINPGNEGDLRLAPDHKTNPGIPQCNESMLGEMHEFSEDRGFRTMLKRCQRDENKSFAWVPASAIPTYFRTTLPTCKESLHGMKAVVDDGNNSEEVTCQRYQGQMTWTRQGKRIPHKFFDQGEVLSKEDFVSAFGPIPALRKEGESESGFDWVSQNKDLVNTVFTQLFRDVPLTGTDPNLRAALNIAGITPTQPFDQSETLRRIAQSTIESATGQSLDSITQAIRSSREANNNDGGSVDIDVDDEVVAAALSSIGDAAPILTSSVATRSEQQALEVIGQRSLQSALISLDPQTASVMTGLLAGGIIGAIDTTVLLGLDQIPPEVNKFVQPTLAVSSSLLSGYPSTLENLLLTASGGGLLAAVNSTIASAIGTNIVNPVLLTSLTTSLLNGTYGGVPQIFASLGALSALPKLPPELGSLPLLATSLLGMFGQGQSLSQLFGSAGLGLSALSSLLGPNFATVGLLLGGIGALLSVLQSFGIISDCPCGPKCRKTAHGKDSDGNNLLAKCNSMSSNNANSYSPTGLPIPNNTGPIASSLQLFFTLLGSNLIPTNPLNLTSSITTIPRVGQMATRFYDSRFSDQTEFMLELTHTVEAIEKTFKVTDNNITRIESIERKLIDALFNLINNIICRKSKKGGKGLSMLTELIRDVRENAQAIRDLYAFTRSLDRRKKGGPAGVRLTTGISRSIQNIASLPKLSARGCRQATQLLSSAVIPADIEWKSMEPGNAFDRAIRERLGDDVIGDYIPDLQPPFPSEQTIFNEGRVLAESLESRVGSGIDPQPSQTLDRLLTPGQIETLKQTPSFLGDPPLDRIALEGGESLYDRIIGRTGEKDCEQG